MISSLNGILISKNFENLVVDVSGLGYSTRISSGTFNQLPELGEKVFVYTKMIVRENEITLYGFLDSHERDAFSIFIDIHSIGPRTALAILDTFSLSDLAAAIIRDDPDYLTKIPGIGKKTAKKLAIELKDKFDKLFKDKIVIGSVSKTKSPKNDNSLVKDALFSLGYSGAEIEKTLSEMDDIEGLSIEEIIGKFLKQKGRGKR